MPISSTEAGICEFQYNEYGYFLQKHHVMSIELNPCYSKHLHIRTHDFGGQGD